MPALSNAKHELFAQALAKGKTQVEAYVEAGYVAHDGAAARLCGNVRIKARVAEILTKAATRTEITVASITERLLAIAAKGEKSDEAPMLSVGRAALMDAAKLNGLAPEKVEYSGPDGGPIQTEQRIDVSSLSPEHRRAIASIPIHGR